MSFKDTLIAYFGLFGKKRIEYNLICRYQDKCSQRLLEQRQRLIAEAKIEGQKLFVEECSKENFFLKRVPKDSIWVGGCLIIPSGRKL
jgi:hypothetical protein